MHYLESVAKDLHKRLTLCRNYALFHVLCRYSLQLVLDTQAAPNILTAFPYFALYLEYLWLLYNCLVRFQLNLGVLMKQYLKDPEATYALHYRYLSDVRSSIKQRLAYLNSLLQAEYYLYRVHPYLSQNIID